MEVADHRDPLANLSFTPMPKGFVSYMLSIPNADRAMQVTQPPGDDLKGVKKFDPPSTSNTVLVNALALLTPPLLVTPRPC